MSETATLSSPEGGRGKTVHIEVFEGNQGREILLILPMDYTPPEIAKALSQGGYSKEGDKKPVRWSAPWSRETWDAAFEVKEIVDREMGPKVIGLEREELEAFAKGGDSLPARPENLSRKRAGKDVFDWRKNEAAHQPLRDQVNRMLKEMGIFDLYMSGEEGTGGDGKVYRMVNGPLSLRDGKIEGTGLDVPISKEKANAIFKGYAKVKSLKAFVAETGRQMRGEIGKGIFDLWGTYKPVLRSIGTAIEKAESNKASQAVIDKLIDLHGTTSAKAKKRKIQEEKRRLTELLQEVVAANRSQVRISQINKHLEGITNHTKSLKNGTFEEDFVRLVRYVEGRLVEVWNRVLHKPLHSTVEIRIPAAKLRELKKLLDSGLSGPYLVPPPLVQGEYREVSYRASENPPFDTDYLDFSEEWKQLWCRPPKGFSALIYGPPKQGKSTLALDFAGYLARSGFGPVLFASFEEAGNPSLEDKKRRLGISDDLITIKNYLPLDLSGFEVVVVDSISKGKMGMELITRLLEEYPSISFLFISQVTKQGRARGSNEIPHEVDVLVEVKDGIAGAVGRFGSGERGGRFG